MRKSLRAVLDEFKPEEGLTFESDGDQRWDKKVWEWKCKNWDWARRWESTYSGDQADANVIISVAAKTPGKKLEDVTDPGELYFTAARAKAWDKSAGDKTKGE